MYMGPDRCPETACSAPEPGWAVGGCKGILSSPGQQPLPPQPGRPTASLCSQDLPICSSPNPLSPLCKAQLAPSFSTRSWQSPIYRGLQSRCLPQVPQGTELLSPTSLHACSSEISCDCCLLYPHPQEDATSAMPGAFHT